MIVTVTAGRERRVGVCVVVLMLIRNVMPASVMNVKGPAVCVRVPGRRPHRYGGDE